ncbi:MAG: hypothetical protein ACLRZH_05270 [Ruthenibacterium lactatiformans]
MQLFDAHMHYSDTHGPAFDAVRERHGVGACTLACIPQMGVCSTVPDALYYKAVHPEGTVYVMGGWNAAPGFSTRGCGGAGRRSGRAGRGAAGRRLRRHQSAGGQT